MISLPREIVEANVEFFKHRETREFGALETYAMYESCERAHNFLKDALQLPKLPESAKAAVKLMKPYVHELGWFGFGCLQRDTALNHIAGRMAEKAYGFTDKGSKHELFKPIALYLTLDLTYDEYLSCYHDYKLLNNLCYPALIENLDGKDASAFTAKLESLVI